MYIATFYTHFGAQNFYARTKQKDPEAKMMPVPRVLSASCGICVRFELDLTDPIRADLPEDLEAIYRTEDGRTFETLLSTEEE